MKLIACVFLSILFLTSLYAQKSITVIYKQQPEMNADDIKPDNGEQLPPGLPNFMADAFSKAMIFTRTLTVSHDTSYISMIHTPDKTSGITVKIEDSVEIHEIFTKGKFYKKQNNKYVIDTAFNNRSKYNIISTGKQIKFFNYNCEIFSDGKNIFYITKDLHQTINPLFRQFDKLDGAILYAKVYNEQEKNYVIISATSIK